MRLIFSMYVSRLLSRNLKILCTSSLTKPNYKLLRSYVPLPEIQNKTDIRNMHLLHQNADRSEKRYMSALITIKHDNETFYIDMENKRVFLKYKIQDDIMEIISTKVPKALNGHGLGKLVAKVFVGQVTRYKTLMNLLPCNLVAIQTNVFLYT